MEHCSLDAPDEVYPIIFAEVCPAEAIPPFDQNQVQFFPVFILSLNNLLSNFKRKEE
jgi:hypothetical protein